MWKQNRLWLLIALLTFLIIGCVNKDQDAITIQELENLKAENDSLRKIVEEIQTKYVFDSISVRDIPSYKNKYELNSKINGEIVFVGYNLNDKSWAIKFDSVNYNNGRTLINPDTLANISGGYKYELVLDSNINRIGAELKTENDFGKSFNVVYQSIIKAE